jgi:hypothetical protein
LARSCAHRLKVFEVRHRIVRNQVVEQLAQCLQIGDERARPPSRLVPDRLELHAHDRVKRLEESIFDTELRHVDRLVVLAQLLQALVDCGEQCALQPQRAWRERHSDLIHLRLARVECGSNITVEARPQMEAAQVEQAHGLLNACEATREAVRVVGEGLDEAVLVALAKDSYGSPESCRALALSTGVV